MDCIYYIFYIICILCIIYDGLMHFISCIYTFTKKSRRFLRPGCSKSLIVINSQIELKTSIHNILSSLHKNFSSVIHRIRKSYKGLDFPISGRFWALSVRFKIIVATNNSLWLNASSSCMSPNSKLLLDECMYGCMYVCMDGWKYVWIDG